MQEGREREGYREVQVQKQRGSGRGGRMKGKKEGRKGMGTREGRDLPLRSQRCLGLRRGESIPGHRGGKLRLALPVQALGRATFMCV